jgi:hypothetical protein
MPVPRNPDGVRAAFILAGVLVLWVVVAVVIGVVDGVWRITG